MVRRGGGPGRPDEHEDARPLPAAFDRHAELRRGAALGPDGPRQALRPHRLQAHGAAVGLVRLGRELEPHQHVEARGVPSLCGLDAVDGLAGSPEGDHHRIRTRRFEGAARQQREQLVLVWGEVELARHLEQCHRQRCRVPLLVVEAEIVERQPALPGNALEERDLPPVEAVRPLAAARDEKTVDAAGVVERRDDQPPLLLRLPIGRRHLVRVLRDGEAEPSPLLDLGGRHPIVGGGRELPRLAVPAEHGGRVARAGRVYRSPRGRAREETEDTRVARLDRGGGACGARSTGVCH